MTFSTLRSRLLAIVLFLSVFANQPAQAWQQRTNTADPQPSSDEEIFSGPQAGEPLPELSALLVMGEQAGKEVIVVKEEQPEPTLLIFVHNITRPSIGLTRTLSGYAHTRTDDGLKSAVIFLTDDPTEGETRIKRMQHALTAEIPTGISPEGSEGPGSYGLNRNVSLTILIAEKGLVKFSYPLVQPSMQVHLPQILKDLVSVIGGKVPPLESLPGMAQMAARSENQTTAPDMRPLLSPVIRRDAADDEVIAAAERVEQAAARNPAVGRELNRITNTIINAGKLENYGTPKAQEYLKKWSVKYKDSAAEPTENARPAPQSNRESQQ